jgi:hypothetical protein
MRVDAAFLDSTEEIDSCAPVVKRGEWSIEETGHVTRLKLAVGVALQAVNSSK